MNDPRVTPFSKYEARVHYLTACIGGLIGVTPVLLIGQFGNAQTTNLIGLVLALLGNNPMGVLLRFGGFGCYVLGTAFATYLPAHTDFDTRYVSLMINAAAVAILAFLPENIDTIIGLYPTFFAMSFQWASFHGAYGYPSSTIFSTNNTRQFSASLTEVYFNHRPEFMLKAKFFGFTLLSYHAGVAAGFILWTMTGRHFPLFTWILLILSAVNIHTKPEDDTED